MNAADQTFEIGESGELDPLRYDWCTDAPQEVARMLADLVPVGSRVLDVGCGAGSVSRMIADTRNAKIIGIEPIRPGAAAARAGPEVYQTIYARHRAATGTVRRHSLCGRAGTLRSGSFCVQRPGSSRAGA